jgi:hypothetical protein
MPDWRPAAVGWTHGVVRHPSAQGDRIQLRLLPPHQHEGWPSAALLTVRVMCAETVDADTFRDRLAEQLAGIRALALSVDAVLNALREPAVDSAAMGEIAAEQNYRSRSAWEAPIADTHSFAVATLRASSDYVRGFAELFRTDHPPLYAHLPLARAALEAAGTSFWLSELRIGPLDRMKRGLCELLYSANEVAELNLSENPGQSVQLWEGVAQSFNWSVNNGRSKPVIDGTRRPRISESIVQLAGSAPDSQAGNLGGTPELVIW